MNGRYSNYTKVSIVVPAHNEEGNIEPLTEEFSKIMNMIRGGVEVVYVNDGSTDRTEQKMGEAARRYRWVRIVRNRIRQGLTSALSKGFSQARGDILIFYPADLQFHPRDIPKMVEAIENGADMVCGKKQGQYGKWLVSWFYNLLTRMLFPKLKVRDMNSVKAFTREVYNDFPTLREGWHRYLAAFAASRDYVVREIPVTLQKRHSGKSKFAGKSRILKGFTDLIAVKFQVSVFGDPMHLFGKFALLFFFIGLLIAGVAFYYRFVELQGYRPLLYAVIFFELAALVTFIMGIITEALVYLRDSLTDMRAQHQRLFEEMGAGGRGKGLARRDESDDSQYFERSDDRVQPRREDRYERRDNRRTERRDARPDTRPDSRPDSRQDPRPDPRPDSRPDPRRRDSRDNKREDTRDDSRRERRPSDRRRPREDPRLQRSEQVAERESRPEIVEPSSLPEPERSQESGSLFTITDAPAQPVGKESTGNTEPVAESKPESRSDAPQAHPYRSGRRVRRVRPMHNQPSPSESQSSQEPVTQSPNQPEIPDRPLTIKVRELPASTDEPTENS